MFNGYKWQGRILEVRGDRGFVDNAIHQDTTTLDSLTATTMSPKTGKEPLVDEKVDLIKFVNYINSLFILYKNSWLHHHYQQLLYLLRSSKLKFQRKMKFANSCLLEMYSITQIGYSLLRCSVLITSYSIVTFQLPMAGFERLIQELGSYHQGRCSTQF
jgi:hypothetical protein